MAITKYTINKNSKISLAVLGIAVLLTGIGITIGLVVSQSKTTTGMTLMGNKAVQWGTYPDGKEMTSWYNNIDKSKDANLESYNNNVITKFGGWQSFADASKDPWYGFIISKMDLPAGFTPVQISMVDVTENAKLLNGDIIKSTDETHYLAIDVNYKVVDLVHQNDETENGHWQAGVKGLSNWTTYALSYFNYNPDFVNPV
ncbi:hypothetical protein ASO20_00070 [Mycoplasma sp. (ex Biomphalaria glabrata)]|uniref:hypothetical protein n=1 Tax=Mycoplasma sp. (ex Biomphalaria glabrata) TaxID=1749074 RepID=UPI00073A7B3C|nr:hypothetical protein [Mycoplasma sp. (ex Biomphalaria glabrata)]ALV23076.1 hypothetical protein ASO20_00070 [Mycoplasma sp. (ex Biomphalaria glabrata)]